jgi:hypothetical protein
MSFTKITSDGVADNAITADKIASGAVTVSDIPDGEITTAKLSSSLQSTINAAITKDSSTGAANIPSGTTAQRPSSPSNGMIRYNTTTNSLENYTSQGWLKVSSIIPTTISSISGSIYAGLASTLTITGTGFLSSNCIVTFAANGISNQDVSVTASSNTSLTVSVPSAVYSTLSAGVNVNITVTNSDLGTSVAYGMTTIAIPSGGSISTYSTYKVHTFTGSSNFVIPSGFSSTYDYIVVAGGGGCGNSSGWGGGGGAGGLVYQTSQSLITGTYAISIGGGGGPGSQGGNSSAFGQTAIGGGRGGDNAINNGIKKALKFHKLNGIFRNTRVHHNVGDFGRTIGRRNIAPRNGHAQQFLLAESYRLRLVSRRHWYNFTIFPDSSAFFNVAGHGDSCTVG